MNNRKLIYGVLIVIGIAVAAGVRYARFNDINVPWWAFLLALPLMIALIAFDVRSRRSATTSTTSAESSSRGTGTNP